MRKDVPSGGSGYVSVLRQELIARNSAYASLNFLPHVTSYGELPWWFISNRNADGIMGISSQPVIEQFSEGRSGEDDCRRYTARADVRCLLRTGCGANSILH